MVVSELDTLLPGRFLLVSTGRKHYQLSGFARAVVMCLGEETLTAEEIEKRVAAEGIDCDSGRLGETLERLVQLSILTSGESSPPARRRWSDGLLHRYLTLKLDLLSVDRIAPVTGVLSVLFASAAMRYLMPLLLALQIVFCWAYFGTAVASVPKLSGAQFAWLLAGNYAALLVHELGHASACAANKIRHGPIGFCIYLIYPAFYTDVSQSWRVPRSRRAVVDAGGMYMSLLCASFASAAFLLTREPVSRLLAILCDITVLWNLNPFIRMDGYWLMSDLLGVQNLMSVNRDVTWWLLRRIVGGQQSVPSILSPAYRFRLLYIAYYSAFLVFFGYASVQLGAHYLPELVRAYPALTRNLAASLQRFREIGAMVKALFYWLLGTLPLVWILLLLVRWTVALFRVIRKFAFS